MPSDNHHINVFISSTSIDLPEYRRAVQDAILTLGLFPSGMENWAVKDESSIQLCKRKIDDAEIYLGIYAYRYGWRPDGYGGKSITELEYDWATERGIPRLRFIMHDSHPWPETEKEMDAQDALNAFKRRLKQDVVGFFTTPDDLKAQVIAALAGYATQSSAASLVPYLRDIHHKSRQSGLLRALDPRTNDPTYGGRGVTVDQVYVPLNTRQLVRRDDDGTILSGYKGHEGEAEPGRDLSPLTGMEAANGIQRLALLGDPGSGKSTFISFLTMGLSGALLDEESDWMARLEAEGWSHGPLYPVFVVLRDFAQSIDLGEAPHSRTLWQYIEREVVGKVAPDAQTALLSLADEGRLLFLLDGLDEVPQERRGYVRDAIDRFVGISPQNARFIVTCRILSYADPAYQVPGFVEHTIAPLDDAQTSRFIETWYTALTALGSVTSEVAAQRVQDLNEAIRLQGLAELASNPMLLTVMALVHNHLGLLPRETARLYSQCVDLLLLKWRPHDAAALRDLLGIREDDLLRLVWEVAYDAHDRQGEREGTADIEQHAVEMIARNFLNGDAAKAQAFCDYVEKRAGLLIGRGYDRYGARIYTFPHRTFQEFLAGCHLSVNRFASAAADHAKRGLAWRDVLLLAAGNLVFNNRNIDTPVDAASRILEEAAARAQDEDWRLYPLVGEMLLLVGLDNLERDKYGQRALKETRAGLAALVDGGHLPPVERAAAGRTLSRLEDLRSGVGVIMLPSYSLLPEGEGLGMRAGVRALPDIDWVLIPDDGEWIYQKDKHPPLPAFHISRYPITYAQFGAFADAPDFNDDRWWAGMPEEQEAYGRNFRTREVSEQRFRYANHPREMVSWYQAVAFCRWLTYQYQEAGLVPSSPAQPSSLVQPSSPALLPQGEGSRMGSEGGRGAEGDERVREMALKAMVQVARELRARQTDAEAILWECLRDRRLGDLKFRRQHPVANTRYVVDFYCYEHQLAIEVDGGVHEQQREADAQRQRELEAQGVQVLRFINQQIFNQLEDVLVAILQRAHFAFSLTRERKGPGDEGWTKNAIITLPTEQQWEKAARGTDGREYPYKGKFDPAKGNTVETGIGQTSAVGIFPDGRSPDGVLDMSGNVWQWCRNKYSEPDQIEVDDSGDYRVLRGGSWDYYEAFARAVYRGYYLPHNRFSNLGFRVVAVGVPHLKGR